MNSRQRFRETMLFGHPDRVTYHFREALLRPATINRWMTEGLKDLLLEKCNKVYNVGDNIPFDDLICVFGLDKMVTLPINFGCVPAFEPIVYEETDDYIIHLDGSGTKRKDFKKQKEPGFVTRQYLEFPVKTARDYKNILPRYDPYDKKRYPDNWDELKAGWGNRDYIVRLLVTGLFGQVREWLGFENTCYNFYDNPLLIQEMMEFTADFIIKSTEKALNEVSIDWVLIWEDMAYKTASMISPAMVKEYMVPQYKKIIAFFRSKGIDIIAVDCDGNIDELIPIWIENGINATYPIEVSAGMNPVDVRKKYGKNIAMIGGIDKRELAKGYKEIDIEVDGKVPYLLETGGYIPALDHAVPSDIPLQNYIYFLNKVKKYTEGE